MFFDSTRQNNNEKKITVNLIIINPILVREKKRCTIIAAKKNVIKNFSNAKVIF